MDSKKSNSIANITTQQASPFNKPVITNRMQQVYSNALCDSGINSLNSKEISAGDQSDSFSNGKWKRRISNFRLRNIEENVSDSIKTLLLSDEAPSVGRVNHFPVQDSDNFVDYVNDLLAALGSCMAANVSCTSTDPQYDQMRRRYLALRWKSDTIRTLLTEYKELISKTGGKNTKFSKISSTEVPLSASKSRSFSFLNLLRIGRRSPKETPTPLPANLTCDRVRMQEIENQIADLSGSIHLQLNAAILGGNAPTTSSSYRFRLNIAQVNQERSSSILNLSNYYRTSELLNRSSANTLASLLHEWNFTVARRRFRSSNYMINEPSTFQSDSESWRFSSTESILPMEPCATLIADVDKKKLRKSFDLRQFLTAESQRITLELTVMSCPYVELEVRWIPFTRLDLVALEKFPVSQSLAMDSSGKNSFEESSQGSNGAPIIRDRRARGLSPPPGSERDRDGGFESMSSQDIMASNDKLGLPQIRGSEVTGNVPSLLIENFTSETSIFQHEQHGFRVSGKYTEEEYESPANNEGDNTHHDERDLSYLISVIQQSIEDINRQPNRYGKLLNDLSIVIEGLQEQLTTSGKFSANSLIKQKLPPRKMEHDVTNSLSMLDLAISESPSNFTSAVEAWRTPLSSGWDDLDSAIEWHLRNVSLLIRQLGSSERIFIDISDSEGSKNKSLLCIREDLIAMALDSQSEILSDITGLVLSYSESKEPLSIVLQSHCLAYCGMLDRGYQGSQNSSHSPLFPMSFWMNFVWQNANELFYPGSVNRLSTCGENIHPSLMIERESLQAYILKEYAIPCFNEEDEQTLDLAIDTLIEQITDIDLTDASPSREIPLTQLCHRLKPQNFKVLTRFESLKSGSFNNRACTSTPRPTQPTDPSIILALEYLIQQGKLQHELRESDEEVLFRSLETLVDGLASSNVSQDRRNELMNISVTNFICLALTLQHDDDSVTTFASRAICALEELTHSAYGVILQSNQLPFLRTAGPCCSFLKSLTMFNHKIRSTSARSQARAGYSEYFRGNSSCSIDGYNLISPIGCAVLWIMQFYGMEEYRVAALAAWECISASAEASIGQSSSASRRSAFRNTKGHWGGSEDRGPIQAEVWRMNLSDDSAEVRQMALRILQAQKKFRSTACYLDVSQ